MSTELAVMFEAFNPLGSGQLIKVVKVKGPAQELESPGAQIAFT